MPVLAFIEVEDLVFIMDKVGVILVQDIEAALAKVQDIEAALTKVQDIEAALTKVRGTEAALIRVRRKAGANGWVIVQVLFRFNVVGGD